MCIIVLLYNVHLQVLQRHDPATWSGLHGRQYLVHDLRLCHGILSSHLAGQLNYTERSNLPSLHLIHDGITSTVNTRNLLNAYKRRCYESFCSIKSVGEARTVKCLVNKLLLLFLRF